MIVLKANYGQAFTFYLNVQNTTHYDILMNPPVAIGDFVISSDGSAYVNLTNLPVVTPIGGFAFKIDLTLAEMTAGNIHIVGKNGAWDTIGVLIQTVSELDANLVEHNNSGTFGEIAQSSEWDEAIVDHTTLGTFGEVVQNIETSLSGAVWDELLADHTTAGTMGSVMSCIYCAGITAIDFIYTVNDVVSTNPIQGAVVKISTDVSGTNIIWSGVTDAFGVARNTQNNDLPSLDPGTYYFWTYAGGYDFSNPDAEVVS